MKLIYSLFPCIFIGMVFSQYLTDINPDQALPSDDLNVTITGENTDFAQGTNSTNVSGVWFSQGSSTINANNYYTSWSDEQLYANFTIPWNTSEGDWDVNVNSPNDGGVLTLDDGFTICGNIDCAGVCNGSAVYDGCGVCGGPGAIYDCGCSTCPHLTDINPDQATPGDYLQVTITGENTDFGQGTNSTNVSGVWFSQGTSTINASDYWSSYNDHLVYANFDIPYWSNTGTWDVNVNSPNDGGVLTLDDGFTICGNIDCAGVCNGSAVIDQCGICGGPGAIYDCGCSVCPHLTGINPDNANPGDYLQVTITGNNTDFAQGSSTGVSGVWFSQGTSTINANNFWSDYEWSGGDETVYANFSIPWNAEGAWNVNVNSPNDGGVLTLDDGFFICNGECWQDCNGEWGGNAVEDNCGTCDSDPYNDCVQDCNGEWGGSNSSCLSTLSFGALNFGYDEHSVEILLDNPNSSLGGFQFTLTVSPNLLTLTDASGGLAESSGFNVDFNPANNIIVGYNLENNTLDDVMGVLTNLDLSGFVGTEQVDLCITDALLTDALGNLYDLEVGGCITIANQLGDTNMDGTVNVLDVVFIVNLVLQYIEPTAYETWAADINGDGLLNIQDIVMTIDIILPDDGLARSESVHDARIDIYSDKIQISSDGIIAGVELHTSGDYTITTTALAEGWEYYQNNDIILIVDMAGTGISEDITLYYEGTLQIINNLLSDWSGNGISASLNIIPDAYILDSAYPNPFNPTTTLSFALPTESEITLSIYNLQGREVASLVNDNMQAGYHSVVWNADEFGSGIYFVQMIAGDYIHTQKIMLVK